MNNQKKFLIAIAAALAVFFAGRAFSQSIKTNAIKPTGSVALTDEQQGILAVRTAKASVVNIIGVRQQPASSTLSAVRRTISSPNEFTAPDLCWRRTG